MQPKRLFLVACLVLAGCIRGPNLQSQMAAYIGGDPQTLVQTLGVPDKHITVNNVQYLAYVTSTNYVPYGIYDGYYYTSYPPIFSCETTFTVKDDRVFSFNLRGDDCN